MLQTSRHAWDSVDTAFVATMVGIAFAVLIAIAVIAGLVL